MIPSAALLILLRILPAADAPARSRAPIDFEMQAAFSLFVDQDVLFGPAIDQDFTMGLVATWSGGWVKTSAVLKPLNAMDRLAYFPRHWKQNTRKGYAEVVSFSFGDSGFTPQKSNLFRSESLPYDRPYANLLFASVMREHAVLREQSGRFNTPRWAHTSELTAGMLGLGLGRAAQTWIHINISDDILPKGWDHQISDGGEPTIKYRQVQKLMLWDRAQGSNPSWDDKRKSDLHVFAEEDVGYYTSGSLGFRFRVGRIQSPWWTGDRMPNSTTKVLALDGARQASSSEFFFSLSGAGTLWAYNALMQGQFRDSDVTLSFREPAGPGVARLKRLTADLQAGVTWRKDRFGLAYQVTVLSPLFGGVGPAGERLERTHTWGGLYLTWQK